MIRILYKHKVTPGTEAAFVEAWGRCKEKMLGRANGALGSTLYRDAHEQYLRMRNQLDDLGIAVTAGGMPDRVKCLHALVAHSLAVGRGVNPIGDRAVDSLGEYFRGRPPCARLDGIGTTPPPA